MKKISFVLLLFIVPFLYLSSQTRLQTCIKDMDDNVNSKNYAKAIEFANEAIKMDPSNYRVWGQRSHCYFNLQDYLNAMTDVNKALELKPGNPDALKLRIFIKIKVNDMKGAESDCNELFTVSSKNDKYFMRGYLRYCLKDYENAEKDFLNCYGYSDEDKGRAGYYLGIIYQYYLIDFKKARDAYAVCLWKEPKNVDAWSHIGVVYFLLRDFKSATSTFSDLMKEVPQNAFFKFMYAKSSLMLDQRNFSQKNFKDIKTYFEQAVELDPMQYEAKLGLLQLKIRTKDYEGVDEALDTLSNYLPTSIEVSYEKGLLAYQQGKNSLAFYQMNKVLVLNPRFPEAYLLRAKVRIEKANYAEAYDDLNYALMLDSLIGEAWLLRGKLSVQLFNGDHAMADYTKATQYQGLESQAYLYRGLEKQRLGDLNGAEADLYHAHTCNWDDVEIEIKYANLKMLKGDFSNAYDYFHTINRDKGNFSAAWSGEGQCLLLWKKKYSEARVDFEKAISLDAKNRDAYFGLGKAYVGLKKYSEAIEAFTSAIALDKTKSDAYYERGCMYLKLKDKESAYMDFDDAETLGDVVAAKLKAKLYN